MQLLVGGLFGALGQLIRIVVGMKKLNDKALHQKQSFGEAFNTSTLFLSILIGFVAGALGILPAKVNLGAMSSDQILLLIGIGYAGADFIEGFIRKSLPASSTEVASEEQPPPKVAALSASGPAAGVASALRVDPGSLEVVPPVG